MPETPPAWVDSQRCNNCSKAFGLFRRDHHCRNCGGNFCGTCTTHSTPIPKYGFVSPVRVCDKCYKAIFKEMRNESDGSGRDRSNSNEDRLKVDTLHGKGGDDAPPSPSSPSVRVQPGKTIVAIKVLLPQDKGFLTVQCSQFSQMNEVKAKVRALCLLRKFFEPDALQDDGFGLAFASGGETLSGDVDLADLPSLCEANNVAVGPVIKMFLEGVSFDPSKERKLTMRSEVPPSSSPTSSSPSPHSTSASPISRPAPVKEEKKEEDYASFTGSRWAAYMKIRSGVDVTGVEALVSRLTANEDEEFDDEVMQLLSDFTSSDGLKAFSDLLLLPVETKASFWGSRKVNKNDKIQLAVLKCLELLIDAGDFLADVLTTKGLIFNVASLTDSPSHEVKLNAYKLLCVLCYISPEGRSSVINALGQVSKAARKKKSYIMPLLSVLITDERDSKAKETKAHSLILLNGIINAGPTLEERVDLRRKLMDELDLVGFEFPDLIVTLKNLKYDQLDRQIEILEEEMDRDKQESRHLNVDLSDPLSVFNALKENAQDDGFSGQLLQTLQLLLTIPSDRSLGERLWNNVNYIVQLATMADPAEDGGKPEPLSFRVLKDLLAQKEQIDVKQSTDRVSELEKRLETQRQEFNEEKVQLESSVAALEAEKVTFAAELEELKKQVEEKTAESVPTPEPAVGMVDSAEVETLRKELEQLRVELQAAKSAPPPVPAAPVAAGGAPPVPPPAPGAPAAPPAPPAPGAPAAPPAPGVPGAPPAPGVPGAPPAPGVPGAPPAPGVPGAPPAPGVPGAPPAPGVPGAPPAPGIPGAPMAPVMPKLPPKREFKPRNKMRRFHWSLVSPLNIEKSLWIKLSDDKVKIDPDEFEALFGQKAKAAGQSRISVVEKESAASKRDVVHLVDPKRAYNVDISLARLRMSHAHIHDAILSLDQKVLDGDVISQLIKCVPTPEDVDMIQGYDGDVSQLGNTEQFFHTVATIPRIQRRLELFLFYLQFDNLSMFVEGALSCVSAALNEISDSKRLRSLLQTVLAFGNYMNAGTKKGNAYGFKLSALPRMASAKSADNSTNLLRYLVVYGQNTDSSLTKWYDDLSHVKQASGVEHAYVGAEIRKMETKARQLETEMKVTVRPAGDKFVPKLEKFAATALSKVQALSERYKKLTEQYEALRGTFAETAKVLPWEIFFSKFSEFIATFQKEEGILAAMKEAEKKKQKRGITFGAPSSAAPNKKDLSNALAAEMKMKGVQRRKSKKFVSKLFGSLKKNGTIDREQAAELQAALANRK